jgi:hypothetical protein
VRKHEALDFLRNIALLLSQCREWQAKRGSTMLAACVPAKINVTTLVPGQTNSRTSE